MEKTVLAGNGIEKMEAGVRSMETGDRRLPGVAEVKTGRGAKSRKHGLCISIQRLLLLMAAVMMSLTTFSACFEEDEISGDPDENGNGDGDIIVGVTGKRIKTIVITGVNSGSPVRHEFSYKSDGTVERIEYYDSSSKLVMRDIITCNSDGTWNKLEQTDLAYTGIVLVLNHTYDSNKKPLKIQGASYSNGVEVGTTSFDFTFQNGRKISQKQTVSAGIVVQEIQTEFTYDSNGRRTKAISTPLIGIKVEYTRTYNSDGTLQNVKYFDGYNQVTMTFTWESGKTTVNMDDIWGW